MAYFLALATFSCCSEYNLGNPAPKMPCSVDLAPTPKLLQVQHFKMPHKIHKNNKTDKTTEKKI